MFIFIIKALYINLINFNWIKYYLQIFVIAIKNLMSVKISDIYNYSRSLPLKFI